MKPTPKPAQEEGAQTNAGWDADSFPSSSTADDDDWDIVMLRIVLMALLTSIPMVTSTVRMLFGTGWDTDSPNIMSSNESFNDVNVKRPDMVSENGQSHITEFDDHRIIFK